MVFGLRSSPATLPIPVNSVDGLFSGLTSAWLSDPSGRLLVSAYAITFVTVTTRAVLQRRKQKKALREQQQDALARFSPQEQAPTACADSPHPAGNATSPVPADTSAGALAAAAAETQDHEVAGRAAKEQAQEEARGVESR